MKIKIGDKIYDNRNIPMMIIIDEDEKYQICHMVEGDNKFCAFPNIPHWIDNHFANIKEWMKNV